MKKKVAGKESNRRNAQRSEGIAPDRTIARFRPLVDRPERDVKASPRRRETKKRKHKRESRDRRKKERELIDQVSKELVEEIKVLKTSEEEAERNIRRILAKLPQEDFSGSLTRMLFRIWSKDGMYDKHMSKTGHEIAIDHLLGQLVALDRLNQAYGAHERVIGPRILELAGGTGTVIKLLSANLEEGELRRLNITLNDVSSDMKNVARMKLGQLPCKMTYSGYDIRRLALPEGSVDTAILAQVLHLLTDPNALKMELDPDYLMTVGKSHIQAKIDVVRRAFDVLSWNGYFILIDEWPAVLSESSNNPVERMVENLFRKTFRPVGRRDLRDSIMKNIPFARFVAELKIPIDAHHAMYLHLYRKDFGKPGNDNARSRKSSEKARRAAEDKIFEAFLNIDEVFRHRYKVNHLKPGESNRLWVEFLPMEGPFFDSRSGEDIPSRKHSQNGAVLAGILHSNDEAGRFAYMEQTLAAIRPGGWLMVMDEWPAKGPNYLPKHQFRDTFMKNFYVIFEGSLRSQIPYGNNGVYGYLFRKIM